MNWLIRHRVCWCCFCLTVFPLSAWAQNSTTDSQNLRALVEEVRQLRLDLQAATVASQRVQIVLYQLQFQSAAVSNAMRAVDDARHRLDELAAERQQLAGNVQRAEDRRKRSQDGQELKMIEEEVLPEIKRHEDRLAAEEERWRTRLGEAEAQLRTEQAKLDALRESLDRLEQSLTAVANKR